MTLTRRQLLVGSSGALPRSAAPASSWNDDRLGIACNLGPDEASARQALASARAAGFRRCQISFPWMRVDDSYLRSLRSWLRNEDLRAEALSAYVNCCNPEIVIMDCRREDFARALEVAGNLECRHLVAWTGGYGTALMKPDPRNFTPQAADAICKFLEGHTRRLETAGLVLALETYVTLACPDAPSLRRLLGRLPSCVGAVLDPPNLTPPRRYAQREQVLHEMVATLRDRVALVHLKDFLLTPDGQSYQLPGPLQGAMNYPLFVDLILSLPASLPIVAEHVARPGFATVRARLLSLFAEAARRQRQIQAPPR